MAEPRATFDVQVTVRLPDETPAALDALAVKLTARDGRPVARAEAHRRALLAGIDVLSKPADHEMCVACNSLDCENCEGNALRGPCQCICRAKALV